MSKCHEIEILLAEYVSGRLDPSQREAVDSHLAACQSCRRELAGIESLFGQIAPSSSGEPIVPEEFFYSTWPALYSRIQAEGLARPEPRRGLAGRLRELLTVRRPGAYGLVNLGLILLVSLGLYLAYIQESRPLALNDQQIEAASLTWNDKEPVLEGYLDKGKILAAVAGLGVSADRDPLDNLGRLLDPGNQRRMYDNLTDSVADLLVSL
jgi:hypothetical protein